MSFASLFPASVWQPRVGLSNPLRKVPLHLRIKCEKTEKEEDSYKNVSVERPPYNSYMDSTSGQLEPGSGARACIPDKSTGQKVQLVESGQPGLLNQLLCLQELCPM